MTDITRNLAAFAATLSLDDIPDEVVARAQVLIADTTGIAVRARHDAESTASVVAAATTLASGTGCTVFGDAGSYSPIAAALINGTLAHSLDFDDTHATASLHSTAPILPAALAVAELCGASGADLVAGVIAGYEVQIRLALALVPEAHYDRGFHPTATTGTFGAAAAAGRVMGLDAKQIENAFGAAGSQAAGSMQFLENGSYNKRFHVGQASANGLLAATLAANGYFGSAAAIEGKRGFLAAYSPTPKFELADKDLGSDWQTMNLAVKPYPSCRYSHAAMDALVSLRAANDVDYRDVETIEVGLSSVGYKIIGDPEAAKRRPTSIVDGQFSMPFCAAVVLREGGLAWDDYGKHLADTDTLALCERVSTVVEERAESEFPRNMSANVRMLTKHGAFESFVKVPKGEPTNFVTEAEIRSKFLGLVEPYAETKSAENLLGALLTLSQQDNIATVIDAARHVGAEVRLVAQQ